MMTIVIMDSHVAIAMYVATWPEILSLPWLPYDVLNYPVITRTS